MLTRCHRKVRSGAAHDQTTDLAPDRLTERLVLIWLAKRLQVAVARVAARILAPLALGFVNSTFELG